MFKFKSLALAAVLALALPGGFAMAASPTAAAAAEKGPTKAQYDDMHKQLFGMISQYRAALSSPENGARLTQLPVEMAKLPALEKAYVDAKNAGKEAEAQAAVESYVQTVQHVIELAMPLNQMVGSANQQLGQIFGRLGSVGEKILAEKDMADLQADIKKTLAPLVAADEQVGPLHDQAVAAARVRLQLLQKQIFEEELGKQVTNALQGKLAQ